MKQILKRIDWVNHIVAFLSTLFGIFIAFQLDDWQQENKQQDELKITLQSIQKEIEENISVYRANAALSEFVEYLVFVRSRTNSKGEFVVSKTSLSPMKQRFPERFSNLRLLYTIGDTVEVYKSDFVIDIIPRTGISTNNWEAAKSSGVLNFVNHERMVVLTAIYDWIQKDLGFTESEFYKRNLFSDDEFSNIDRMLKDYARVAKVSQYKLERILNEYNSMNWNLSE